MNSICRNSTFYPICRQFVSDEKVSWNIPWKEYIPPYFTAPHLISSPWADPEIEDENFKPQWNAVDGNIDRQSYDQSKPIKYAIVNKVPLNPRGRTGLCGRGRLGRWGPNHAADAVVTRWKRLASGSQVMNNVTGLPILQFLAILRQDCKKWAIPGGFLEEGENPSNAMIRELFEEAVEPSNRDNFKALFQKEYQIYKGYVDDPRNTDNSWIETTACNFHDESGQYTDKFTLKARDDAADVKWVDIVEEMKIYQTHSEIIKHVNDLHLSTFQEKCNT